MKRKIEDYENKLVAIFCSSIEEWDKINDLLGKKGLTRDYGDISDPDNAFVDCIHINGKGTASKKHYEQASYTIYSASDFLETEIIPEYVEYIDTKYKGQIVKVEEWTSHSFCCIRFENGQREQPFKHLVKSSTKDAYEAQNEPKQLTIDDLIKGEIYVFDINSTKNFISKFDYSDSLNYYDSYYIQGDEFNDEPESATISAIKNIRLATNEEKKWLNTCISQDKFISKEDLHLYDNSGLLIKKEEVMFKEGDYIYVLGEDTTTGRDCKDKVLKIKSVDLKSLNKPYVTTDYDKCGGIYFDAIRMATATEINTLYIHKKEEKTKSILEEAKERYPIGTKFKSVITNTIFTVKNHTNEGGNSRIVFHTIETNSSGNNWGCVHQDNKWAEIISLPNEEEWIPKVDDWCVTTTHYNDEIWYKGRVWQIGRIDEEGFCIPIQNGKLLDQSLKIGFRKALPHEIPIQYPLAPKESFKTEIYDFGDIYIPSIIKKQTKLQTITIESTTDLNLGIKTIKSKQIKTIKI